MRKIECVVKRSVEMTFSLTVLYHSKQVNNSSPMYSIPMVTNSSGILYFLVSLSILRNRIDLEVTRELIQYGSCLAPSQKNKQATTLEHTMHRCNTFAQSSGTTIGEVSFSASNVSCIQ